MKAVLAVALIAAAAATGAEAHATVPVDQIASYSFESFTRDFNRRYATAAEASQRRAIFEKNRAAVVAHNAKGTASYTKGINDMSDRTIEEIAARARGTMRSSSAEVTGFNLFAPKTQPSMQLPASVDYRAVYPPVLTAVKDQGKCGSCWAQCAIATIESGYALKTGKLFDLSTQQLVSCVANPKKCGGTGGCNGATVDMAYDHAVAHGCATEWTYSYASYFGGNHTCSTDAAVTLPVVQPTGYVMVKSNDQVATMEALVAHGPLSVVVDASDWHSYNSGIYSGCDYKKNITINHGVQLVGYGTDKALKKDYWIIRNSWSANWGENGYMRLEREPTPKCGWSAEWTTYGLGCEGDAEAVWSCGHCGVLMETSYVTF